MCELFYIAFMIALLGILVKILRTENENYCGFNFHDDSWLYASR